MGIIAVCMILLGVTALAAQHSLVPVIDIHPNPMEKYTVITVRINQSMDLGINIEAEDGHVVKTLYWGQANKDVILEWDRIGDDGTITPNGTYDVVVNYSGRYTSTKKTLILK
jgi:flagellar hook assembly protein FlgD